MKIYSGLFILCMCIAFVFLIGCTSQITPSKSVSIPGTPTPVPIMTSSLSPTPAPTIATFSTIATTNSKFFSDDLTQHRPGWDMPYSDIRGKVFYSSDGLHIIDNTPPTTISCTELHKTFDNFILNVDIKVVDSSRFSNPQEMSGNWYSVIFRHKDANDHYSIGILDSDFVRGYNILRFSNGIPAHLEQKSAYSEYINSGKNAVNHLTINCSKYQISLSVNDHPIETVTDSAFNEGTILLCSNSGEDNTFCEGAFSNLTITSVSTVPQIQNTISSLTELPTIQKGSVTPTIQSTQTQKDSSFPHFDSADKIVGMWGYETMDNRYVFKIKDDTDHHFLLTLIPKNNNYAEIQYTGKIIQISKNQFKMNIGWDPSKTGEQNSALVKLNDAMWHYDESTGEFISDQGLRYTYLGE